MFPRSGPTPPGAQSGVGDGLARRSRRSAGVGPGRSVSGRLRVPGAGGWYKWVRPRLTRPGAVGGAERPWDRLSATGPDNRRLCRRPAGGPGPKPRAARGRRLRWCAWRARHRRHLPAPGSAGQGVPEGPQSGRRGRPRLSTAVMANAAVRRNRAIVARASRSNAAARAAQTARLCRPGSGAPPSRFDARFGRGRALRPPGRRSCPAPIAGRLSGVRASISPQPNTI